MDGTTYFPSNPLENIPPIANAKIYPSFSRHFTAAHHTSGKPIWHVGEDTTLTYCASGLSVMNVNGQFYLFRPGQMMLAPKGMIRGRTPISNDLVLYELVLVGEFNGEELVSFLQIGEGNYVVDIPQDRLEKTRLCFEQSLNRSPEAEADISRAAATLDLIGIYFNARVQMEKSENMFSPVLSYMHAHLSDGVTLSELAALLHMQPTYFIRLFKKMFMQSPIAYFNTLRITAAIEILSTTTLTLSQVAAKIGMSDPYHFSNFFKNHCGISPSQYRESIKEVKKQMERL